MHCVQCGEGLPDRAHFCSECGAATAARNVSATTIPIQSGVRPGASKGSPPTVVWALGAAAAVILLFVVLGNFARSDTGSALFTSSAGTTSLGSTDAMHKAMDGGLSSNCTPGKFRIKQQHSTAQYGYLTVVGVVRNGCNEAAGVQLKLNQYDAKGDLVATDDEWPAGISNIAPGQDYDFKLMATAPESAVKYSILQIEVQRW